MLDNDRGDDDDDKGGGGREGNLGANIFHYIIFIKPPKFNCCIVFQERGPVMLSAVHS